MQCWEKRRGEAVLQSRTKLWISVASGMKGGFIRPCPHKMGKTAEAIQPQVLRQEVLNLINSSSPCQGQKPRHATASNKAH